MFMLFLRTSTIAPYKIVFVGASGVGKTALLNRFFKKTFSFKEVPKRKEYTSELVQFAPGCYNTVDVIDIKGPDEFAAVKSLRNENGIAIVVVYSIDNEQSLNIAIDYMEEITRVTGSQNEPLLLVGNKLGAPRQVSTEQGLITAKERGWLHLETSAFFGFNVTALFQAMFTTFLSISNTQTKLMHQNTPKRAKLGKTEDAQQV